VSPRALLMTILQVIWSSRLSYNTYRRGLFSLSDEDYRWAVLRKWLNGPGLSVFNWIFIAATQNVILFLLGLPAYSASVSASCSRCGIGFASAENALHYGDLLLASLVMVAILTEFTADNQQWAFHNYKQTGVLEHDNEWPGARINFVEEDKQRGFLTKGLWAYSRHPNVACEQTIWLLMSCFPLVTNAHIAHNIFDFLAMLTPSIALSTLLLGSTFFTEYITEPKYVGYKHYKRRVAMFWPLETLRKAIWVRLWEGKKESEVLHAFLWGDAKPTAAKAIKEE